MSKSGTENFLNETRLEKGPWGAFERDFGRLLFHKNFNDVRLVGGKGDQGADVLGVIDDQLWVFQCKHTTSSIAPAKAVQEVVLAGRAYGADQLGVVISKPPGKTFVREVEKYNEMGLEINVFGPKKISSLMEGANDFSIKRKSLRDEYQVDVAESFYDNLVTNGKGQIVLATGLGKTVVMAEVVSWLFDQEKLPNGKVLVLAHVKEIVRQLTLGFWDQLPKWVSTHILMGGEFPSYWEGVTFSTIQSAKSHLNKLPEFDLVLIDEAHHVGANTFQKVINSLQPSMIGGVTATPWRGDGFDIDEILGPPVAQMGISEGLAHGFLCDVDYRLIADNINWDFVRDHSKYKYSIKHLNKKLLIPERDDKAARMIATTFDEENRNSAILFSPSIDHATNMAAWLKRYGYTVEVITSDQNNREQDILMSNFRAGKFQIAVTVDMFNEGVDIPDVDMVVFMRATHSRRIFVQQLGRGLRISKGKDKVIVLDFVSDLKRMAMVLNLDKSVKSNQVERIGLGERLIEFEDKSAGSFLKEWLLDQSDLFSREKDPKLELPEFDYPPELV